MELDHVLIGVADLLLRRGSSRRTAAFPLLRAAGHPGWGTANRSVPLAASYLELVAVVDEATAADSCFGRWVAHGASDLGRPLGWAVRTGRIDETARRLGRTISAGSRLTQTGEVLRWRIAGIEQAAAEPSLPFFIEWQPGIRLPGNTTGEIVLGADGW